jgi:L-ascorbate metabolism protein UlaG (beta-lactamase superfamily)
MLHALAIAALAALLSAALAVWGLRRFFRGIKFGARPAGERLERLERSPHWRGGEAQNLEPTPARTPGVRGLRLFLAPLTRPARIKPKRPLPAGRADLASLPDERLVWLGHSGFFLKVGGLRLLFDPVLSPYASPAPFLTRAFPLESELGLEDVPEVDCLLISHDHWDHLDYRTVTGLRERVRSMVLPLGAGAHFERWGFGAGSFLEGDWGDSFEPVPGLKVHLVTARHFAGRGPAWRRCLWTGFVVEAGGRRIYYGGDGGYGRHFREAGERFGGFDLAVLECGQYNDLWPLVHTTPEQTVQAALDLRARAAMPVHCCRFVISQHAWDEPLIRFSRAVEAAGEAAASAGAAGGPAGALGGQAARPLRAVTPMIGEAAAPFEAGSFQRWWEGLD